MYIYICLYQCKLTFSINETLIHKSLLISSYGIRARPNQNTPENSPPSSPQLTNMEKESSFSLSTNVTVKNDLTVVNFPSTLKLTSTNYLGRKLRSKLSSMDWISIDSLMGLIPHQHRRSQKTAPSPPTPTILIGSDKISFFLVLLLAAFPLKSFLL